MENLPVIISKIKQYCAYQERSHYEVKQKLYTYGLYKKEVETIITHLIEENYLNEERFATHLAGSKFRIKYWGKIKIKAALLQHKVSAYNINIALDRIEDEAYFKTLEKLAAKKWNTVKSDTPVIRKFKTQNYLLQKGFEKHLVIQVLNKLRFGK